MTKENRAETARSDIDIRPEGAAEGRNERAGTPTLPVAHAQGTHSARPIRQR
jgi:hypothetical protein